MTSSSCRPSARALAVEMPWMAVAPGGISRPGSTIAPSRSTTSPALQVINAKDTGTSVNRSMPVVSRSKPTSSPSLHGAHGTIHSELDIEV